MDTLPKTLIQGFAISPAYSNDTTLALATQTGGYYKSTDDGANWKSVADSFVSRNYDITFSPFYSTDRTMFASGGWADFVAKSIDGGQTWIGYTVPSGKGPTIIAVSPVFVHDHTVFATTRFGHVNRSTDGGITYTTIYYETDAPVCGDTCLSSFVISPNFANDKLLLVATKSGVHMSSDGGNTWVSKGSNTVFGQQVKLAISPNYAEDHTVFIGGTVGLFLTVDGFNSWQKISGNAAGVDGYVEELAISPNFKNDKTILMSVRGKGLFRSKNGGSNFQAVAIARFRRNYSFALWSGFPVASSSLIRFSPAYATDKTIFATSSDRLFRSRDGGSTWGDLVLINTELGK